MSLSFPNVALLGMSRDSRFFDAGFQYSTLQRVNIQGLITDLTESFGISGTWSGEQGVVNTIRNNQNYQELVLNGVSFGSGRIENITFDAGLDVRTKGYQASLVIYDSGNLFNFTGEYYSGVNVSGFQYLNSFSEDYSFDKKENGGYSLSHSAAIQFTSGVGELNSIAAAQSLAKSLFTGSHLGFAFYSGFTDKQGKRFFTESYNLIDNACSFQATFDFDNNNGSYSATRNHSTQISEVGIVTTVEQGQIRGIENPNYEKALGALNTELTGAYLRCSGVTTQYFPSGRALFTTSISQGRTLDIFNNNLTYNVVFSNDPTNSGSFIWDYTQQIEVNEGIGTVTENGTILGRNKNITAAFNSALNGFAGVKPGIAGRSTSLFAQVFPVSTNYLEQKSESYSPIQAQIGYGYQFSNSPSLVANAGIRRKEVVINDAPPRYLYNKIEVFNQKELVQNGYQSTPGARTTSVAMQGDKTVELSSYLSAAQTILNANAPAGNDRFVADVSYSFAPNEGSVDVTATWVYNSFASQTINP